MVEAHVDALAILAEAERQPTPGATYGVWAANSPGSHLHLTRNSADTLVLSGTKPLTSAGWQIEALLQFAGHSVDLAPEDKRGAYPNAACLRAAIADLTDSVILEAAKLAGPRGLALDAVFSDRTQELMRYVRQHHGAKDLADLGAQADG